MMDRTTSFVVGALTCMVAGASFVTMHLGDAGAADECLAAPKKASSPGQHWYYRIDRATQRHCWYLGDEGKAISRAAKPASERRATLTESDRGAALARSAANVHAEMPMPQMSRDDDAKVASVTPVVSAAPDSGSAAQGASRDAASEPAKQPDVWRALDAASSQGATSEPPKPASSAASVAPADATPDARNEPDAAPSAPTGAVAAPAFTPPPSSVMPPVQTSRMEAPAMGRATSLSALFLAAFGALVFVTLATGLAYFFTDRARHRQPEGGVPLAGDWPVEPFRIPSSLRLLPHESMADEALRARGQLHRAGISSRPTGGPGDHEVRQIEQLLTRVVRRSETLRGQIGNLTSESSASG
jgi:hypothetical protein